ncbi:nucleotidyltransferase family protein [Faecalitalea cylindroides]|uniref:nucleotidyltransferase family protein n=1 Tax=Faecalitalea cylindroides TaxID=39483 RepID=UPI0039F4B4BB
MSEVLLSKEQQTLCHLLANVLFHENHKIEEDVDFGKVYECARKQAVVMPAFLNINEYSIDSKLKQKIFSEILSQTNLIAKNYSHHAYLHELMIKHNIDYCILKGVASAHYYPQMMIRQMGDVDFIVKPQDLKKVDEILSQEGFRCWHMNHVCHEVYTKDDMHFEMHFDFIGMPEIEHEEIVREILKDFFKETREIHEDMFTFVIPNDFYHGLVMLMHTQKHLLAEGFGLRHLCDWALFIQSIDDFEKVFKEKLKKIGLWNYASLLSRACSIAFDLPYQDFMSDDTDLALKLLKDILDGGNFGANNDQRVYESMFVTDNDRHVVSRNRPAQFIKTINSKIENKWAKTKKYPILYLFGWIYFPLRLIIRICLKKRAPIKLKQAYSKSKDRKELYEKIKLYK